MAWETPGLQQMDQSASQVLAEESARVFMGRVYRWMFGGLAITATAAVVTASSPALLEQVAQLSWALYLAEIGLVLALTWAAPRLSGPVAAVMFIAYAAMNGLLFSFIFYLYELGSIGQALFLTAGVFAALSIYATVTKKDLSAWKTFLFMGLIGVVLAGVVQVFVRSPGLSFVWSCACVVVFAGLTAYDTQKLRRYHADSGYSSAAALSIVGALILYLDFVNLFIALLRLFGRRR